MFWKCLSLRERMHKIQIYHIHANKLLMLLFSCFWSMWLHGCLMPLTWQFALNNWCSSIIIHSTFTVALGAAHDRISQQEPQHLWHVALMKYFSTINIQCIILSFVFPYLSLLSFFVIWGHSVGMLENQVKDDVHMIIFICAVDQQASLAFSNDWFHNYSMGKRLNKRWTWLSLKTKWPSRVLPKNIEIEPITWSHSETSEFEVLQKHDGSWIMMILSKHQGMTEQASESRWSVFKSWKRNVFLEIIIHLIYFAWLE